MSTPFLRISPATPRKDAAERYSPLTAAAFHRGLTVREATSRSEVVRASRRPYAPITTVTAMIARIAGRAYGLAIMPAPPRRGVRRRSSVVALDEIGKFLLGPLGD